MTALNCGTPDRVPINTYEMAGRNSQDWYNTQPSYAALMDFIRQHTDCITNWGPALKNPHTPGAEPFLFSTHPVQMDSHSERVGNKVRTVQTLHTPKGKLQRVLEAVDDVYTLWVVEHWCKSVDDVDKALSIPYQPPMLDASDLQRVQTEIGEHGLIMASVGDPAYEAAELMSFQDYTLWAFEHTDHYARTVDFMAERVLDVLQRSLASCVVDLYRIYGPEYMTPPYMPPSFFERFMVPHLKTMVRMIHGAGAKVRIHSHGKINKVLDMILDCEPDGIDPCEPPPDGDLELDQVKKRCYSRGVSVWGNIELRLLEQGTPEMVRAEVAHVMEQAKAGGGFVFMPTAAPINVPLHAQTERNYRVMIETALELGRY